LAKGGYQLDPEVVQGWILIAAAYLVGQGVADFGKGAKELPDEEKA
jgi:hypothetical protein